MEAGEASLTLLKAGTFLFKGNKAFEIKVGGTTLIAKTSKILLG